MMQDPLYTGVGIALLLAAVPAIIHAFKQHIQNKKSPNVILSLSDAFATLITGIMLLTLGIGLSSVREQCDNKLLIADSALLLIPSINAFTSTAVRIGLCLDRGSTANCNHKKNVIAIGMTWAVPTVAVLSLLPIKTNQFQQLKKNADDSENDTQNFCEIYKVTLLPNPKEVLAPCEMSSLNSTVTYGPIKRKTDDVRYLEEQTIRRIYEIVNLTLLANQLEFRKILKINQEDMNYENEDYIYDTSVSETGPGIELGTQYSSQEESNNKSEDLNFSETTTITINLDQTSLEKQFLETSTEMPIEFTTFNDNCTTLSATGDQNSITEPQVGETYNVTKDFCVTYCYMEARSLRVHMLFILLGAHVLPMVTVIILSVVSRNHSNKETNANLQQSEFYQSCRIRSLTIRASIISIAMWLPALTDTILRSLLCISGVSSDTSRILVIIGLLHNIIRSAFGAKFAAIGNMEVAPSLNKNLAPDNNKTPFKLVVSEQPGTSTDTNVNLDECMKTKQVPFNLKKIFVVTKDSKKMNIITHFWNKISAKENEDTTKDTTHMVNI